MGDIKFASIIVTYRCNARCHMCNTWQFPSKREEELGLRIYEKLPFIKAINVTGGEPFLREDIADIIEILRKKTNRLVISSNGFFTERILKLFSKRKDIGIRISIEGLPKTNDELRGIKDGFDRGLRTLIELHHRGVKDIGFGITLSDRNAKDLMELYHLAKVMKLEFATAAMHNSFYFHKHDNAFLDPGLITGELRKLTSELLSSKRVKDWFRAYFNYGLIEYVNGRPRLLPCEMGHDSFFLDPGGEIFPCNVMEEGMGNLVREEFSGIWQGEKAREIRQKVQRCERNCWMMGSVGQQMKKYLSKPALWILKNKFRSKQGINCNENGR